VLFPPFFIIPPRQKSYKVSAACIPDCTKNMNAKGIDVYGGMAYARSAVTGIKLRHIRGKTELEPIFKVDNYDYKNQFKMTLDKERKVLPGDSLELECTYNTVDRKEPTFGGFLSTKEEFCSMTLWYYPKGKGDVFSCFANPELRFYADALNVHDLQMDLTHVNPFVKMVNIAKRDSDEKKISLVDAAKEYDWSKEKNTEKFIEKVSKATYLTGCIKPIFENGVAGLNVLIDRDEKLPSKEMADPERHPRSRGHHHGGHHGYYGGRYYWGPSAQYWGPAPWPWYQPCCPRHHRYCSPDRYWC